MKKEFVTCKYRYQAIKAMPWAAKIVKVDGGYMGFESITDYRNWKTQL
jgi:hypothetical protein